MAEVKQVSVQHDDFDIGSELAALRQQSSQVGAIASFVGVVRDIHGGKTVSSMTLEHYPGMTEKCLQDIVDEAMQHWQLLGARVVHRIGCLQPSEQIVLVAVSSMHRGESFQACEFIMDYLKTRAPFWKKEAGPSGERWVDAREGDQQSAERWH